MNESTMTDAAIFLVGAGLIIGAIVLSAWAVERFELWVDRWVNGEDEE